MRSCSLCKSRYPDDVEVCRIDGRPLTGGSGAIEATAELSIADPPYTPAPGNGHSSAVEVDREASVEIYGPEALLASHDSVADASQETRLGRTPRPPTVSHRAQGTGQRGASLTHTSSLQVDGDFSMVLSRLDEPQKQPTEPPEHRIGLVLGSYRIREVIGRGGMGCVYRAEHVRLGRDVALKLLRDDYAERKDAVERFFQEARAVNRIRHKNIVEIIDYVEPDEGSAYIIMELLDGYSLGRLMRAAGGIPLPRALDLLAQICNGLSAAHAVGIVHRDLKPDNIIVTQDEERGDVVKILDFGVAKLIDKSSDDRDLTAVGSVIGTPAYMSPEQAGGLQVDPRSDIYSLGAIMYQMFAQRPPFRGSSFGEYVRLHLNSTPRRPRDLPACADLDPRIDDMIMRCLSKSPDARYPSAKDLRGDLLDLLAELRTVPPDTPEPSDPDEATHLDSDPMAPKMAMTPPPMAAAAPIMPEPVGHRAHSDPGIGHPAAAVAPPSSPQLPAHSASWDPVSVASGAGMRPPTTTSLGEDKPFINRGLLWPLVGAIAAATLTFVIAFKARQGDNDSNRSATTSAATARPAQGTLPIPDVQPLVTGDSAEVSEENDSGHDDETRVGTQVEPITSEGGTQPAVKPLVTPDGGDDSATSGNSAKDKGSSATHQPPTEPKPQPVQVRIRSNPAGKLYAVGQKRVICETPCSVSVTPQKSTKRKAYVIKRKGYKPARISIDLSKPPPALDVSLVRRKTAGKSGGSSNDDTTFNPFGQP